MTVSRSTSGLLLAAGAWNWLIWPNFLRNIAADDRAFSDGAPTSFFLVHLALTVVSLGFGTALAVAGWRGWRSAGAGATGAQTRRNSSARLTS